ncbi:MAG: GNAT family N-acetyltransferase [Deltaproteobacteria bacterium]|nr:GNAT family N-acetyltransferase [Deltaproteobacteria bacterium]
MLRQASRDDLEHLLEMMVEFNRLERVPFDKARTRLALLRLLDDRSLGRVLLVLDGASAIAGYVVLTYGYDLEFGGRDAFLTEVYLEPHARRRGLATRALADLDALAREDGASAIHLGVYADNAPAVALYERAGYQPLPRVFYSKRLR